MTNQGWQQEGYGYNSEYGTDYGKNWQNDPNNGNNQYAPEPLPPDYTFAMYEANPGSGYPGSDYPGSGYPGSGNPGSDNPGSGYPGSDYPGSGYPGSGNPGSDNPGSGYPGSGYPGPGNPGSGYPGSGNPGSGYPGSGNPGTGYPGSGGIDAMEEGSFASSGNTMNDFTEASIRKGFIRKVFAILSIQLVVTFGIMSIFVFSEDAKKVIQENVWIFIAAAITVLVLSIALACCEKLRRKSPANIICLGIYTLAMSWLLSSSASYFDADEVLIAVGMCMGVTFIMFLFGLQTKFDFTWMIGPLVSVLFCLIMFGLLALIMQSRVMSLLYSCIGAVVFSLFITVDVQLVVGKGRYALDSEEYILAALNIYLDIVNLLLIILSIMKKTE